MAVSTPICAYLVTPEKGRIGDKNNIELVDSKILPMYDDENDIANGKKSVENLVARMIGRGILLQLPPYSAITF